MPCPATIRISLARRALCLALCELLLLGKVPAQQPAQSPYTFRARTEVVLVNVTVRDRKGALVRDLNAEDFTVVEDNKPQKIASFDVENADAVPSTVAQPATLLVTPPKAGTPKPEPKPAAPASDLKDHRLIVLFFDLSAMQPDEIDRSVTAASNYLDKQMAPADLVAVVSLANALQVDQDFTSDRAALKQALQRFSAGSGQGFEAGSTGTTEGTPDTAQAFTADDTEYNIFNTDRRLQALRWLASALSHVNQKKSVIYFSSGMSRTGVENQSELRAATNEAVRANLSIYTVDIRGLQAMVPGGEAQQASLRGVAPYSGKATLNQYDSNFATQETLTTLAADTGGRSFLDSNDFGQVFDKVQQDTSTYYVLGYHSSNPARDGRFRRLAVQVNRPGLKLVYRRGYYAPSDFQHSTRDDRERQLEEELASELPSTDLTVYLATGYFRLSDNKFFAPVSIVVPGSEIPFTRGGDQDRATLDVLGVIQDESKRPLNTIRDTVKLSISGSQEVRRKNVQYDAGFLVPPGTYHLKFVVRENQSGRLGSFETDLAIPAMKNLPVKMSSVFLSSQVQPRGKRRGENPLVREGQELIPSVTHVFSSAQQLYLYYEIYDPARSSASNPRGQENGKDRRKAGIRVLSNVSFFRGQVKAYETPLVEVQELNAADRGAAIFQLQVPLSQLQPGFYTCQVNVIDDAAGRFTFPRLALLVR